MSNLATLFKKFSNGRQALSVRTNGQTDISALVKALNLPKCSRLLLLSGGAGNMSEEMFKQLTKMFNVVSKVIAENNITVIDGGTKSGVMQLMGESLANAKSKLTHIGVVPAFAEAGPDGLQAEDILEPHHSRFVLVDGYMWGDEVEMMYTLAEYLSAKVPSITLLINGGAISLHEVEWNVRQGREIIVLAGSGRLADEIATAIRQPERNVRDRIATIVRNGNITLFDITSPPEELGLLIKQKLG